MPTIVRRSSEIGDPSLPRVPFPEPGPDAKARVTSLNSQGVGGESITLLEDAASGTSFTPGTGVAPVFKVLESGVPAFRMESTPFSGGGLAATSSTFYRPSGGAVVRSMWAVGRIRTMPTLTDSEEAAAIDRVGAIIRAAGFASSLHVRSVASATSPGAIAARGGGTTEIVGPVVEPSDALHFFGVTFNGASSHLHYDGEIVPGTLQDVTNTGLFMGFSASGFVFEVVEAAQYGVALTQAQMQEKRADKRALFQF